MKAYRESEILALDLDCETCSHRSKDVSLPIMNEGSLVLERWIICDVGACTHKPYNQEVPEPI